MQISDALKAKFLENDGQKLITIYFPTLNGLTLDNSHIYSDSISLKESILEGSSIEFVGCISSTFYCELHGVNRELKGERIEVYVTVEGFEDERIPLFKGYVDSVKTRLTDQYKAITCYDYLYYKASDRDVSHWYNELSFPLTMRQFRDSLCSWIDLGQEPIDLPNDNVVISRQYTSNAINALDLIKNICQLNGVFGIVNRDGKLEYKSLSVDTQGTYPSSYTYPSLILFPSRTTTATTEAVNDSSTMVSYYEDMMYEDFDVYAIDKVIIRDSEDADSVSYGTGKNSYIVQGNVFIYGLDDADRQQIAENIYNNVQGFSYKPFDAVSVGLPFVQVGDLVQYNIADYSGKSPSYVQKSFYVMQRQLKGIQALKDNYSAEGEQYQKIFLSDLHTKLNSIEKKLAVTPTRAEVEKMINDMETPTGFTVASVDHLPSVRDPNVIYLVRGDITIA
ncbi:MAG: hypothetical protein MJ007_01895 [Paludibacteraceae bacterium]|nr:hypothetical protein [Paludibacteraceae bacterium]